MLRLSWLLLPCLVAATHMKKRCVLHNTTAEAAEALTSLVSLRTRLGDWYEEVRRDDAQRATSTLGSERPLRAQVGARREQAMMRG